MLFIIKDLAIKKRQFGVVPLPSVAYRTVILTIVSARLPPPRVPSLGPKGPIHLVPRWWRQSLKRSVRRGRANTRRVLRWEANFKFTIKKSAPVHTPERCACGRRLGDFVFCFRDYL